MNTSKSIVFIMIMIVIGLLIFDNVGVSVAFGIVKGSIFGIVFSGKESKKEDCG